MLDSGSTHHMHENLNTRPQQLALCHSGLAALVNQVGKKLILENFLLVPTLTQSLTSIPCIFKRTLNIVKTVRDGLMVTIDDGFQLQGISNPVINQVQSNPTGMIDWAIPITFTRNLVGPFSTQSPAGYTYFLTLVNQFSSYQVVKFLKTKADCIKQFGEFKAKLEKQAKSQLSSPSQL
ncbi:uncharacterized protein VP01_2958g3 [Puccinia sorghi]|uniref:Uncharacterized protein n=1 Tax=Puccinia sorghi TaxID=27349 RepID=A0A0L6V2N1_9BASI|nr:uncharacterized protein VP01_2958g3 [Puccinia sorghi]